MLIIETIDSDCGLVIVFQRPLGLFLVSEAIRPFSHFRGQPALFCLDYSLHSSVALNIPSTGHLPVDSSSACSCKT